MSQVNKSSIKQLSDTYDFHGKTFTNVYAQFIDTIKKYSDRNSLSLDLTEMKNDMQKIDLTFKVNLALKNIDFTKENYLSELKELKIGTVDILPLVNSSSSSEKKKLSAFLKLLSKTSTEIINSATKVSQEINFFEGIGSSVGSSGLTVDDLKKNLKAKITDETKKTTNNGAFPSVDVFCESLLNKVFSSMGLSNTDLSSILVLAKENAHNKNFRDQCSQMISDTVGKDIYEGYIKNIFEDIFNSLGKTDKKKLNVGSTNNAGKEIMNLLTTMIDTKKLSSLQNIPQDKQMELVNSLLKKVMKK